MITPIKGRSIAENRRRRKNTTVIIVLAILIFIAFIASMNTGYIRLSPMDTIRTLLGGGIGQEGLILFDFRLPRIVIAILVGAGLAVSGCVMQGVSRNELADPGVLGINAGAGLAVLLFIDSFPTIVAAPVFMLPVLAWIGSGLTAALVIFLSSRRQQGFSPTKMLLNGIGVTSGISAITIILTLRISPEKYQFVATWMAGSIWGSNWRYVLAQLPFILVLLPFILSKAQTMNMLSMGEQTAAGLGVRVSRERILLLSAAVGLAGSSVAISGGIGFVGLICPHLARRLVGPKYQVLLPASALIGALLILVADMIGRWILQPSEVPVGIVIAIIGVPYFLYVMARSK